MFQINMMIIHYNEYIKENVNVFILNQAIFV